MDNEKKSLEMVLDVSPLECAELLKNAVKAFARSTYKGVYVVDLFKNNFLYVSDNVERFYGFSREEIKRKGFCFYLENMPDEEQKALREVNAKGLSLLRQLSVGERGDCILSYDFHVKYGKKKRLFHHVATPFLLSEDGQVRLVLCSISLPHRSAAGHFIMYNRGANFYYEFLLSEHCWKKKYIPELSEIEQDVLALSAQGYTMTDMADILCRSVDTVKASKKRLFSKLGVRNIASALSFASNQIM